MYFVYKKGDYQLTRHIKEEYNKVKEGFKRYIYQYLADNDINNDFNKDITAIVFNILTPTTVLTTTSGNFFYDDYSVKYFIILNRPILIKIIKNIVISINNNTFAYSLTSSMEPSSTEFSSTEFSSTEPSNMEFSIVRRGNKINIKNLTVNINFLNYYFNNNGLIDKTINT